MSFPPPPPRPAGPARPSAGASRRRGALLPTALVVGGLLLLVSLASELYTDYLWFRQLDFARIYTTRLITQALLFLVAAALMGAAVASSLSLAYRTRPIYAPVSQEAQNLDRYRESLEPLRRVVLVALPVLLGLFAGSAAAGQWQTVLLWLNRQPFGQRDPQFDLDIGFYVFSLPLARFVLGFLIAVLVLSLLAAAATHYLYGGLRLQGPGPRTTRAARVHLAVLAGVLALLQGASYFLDRYSQLINGRAAFVDGAGYTEVNAVIPARFFLAVIAVIVALLFFATIATGNWRIPLGGIGLLVVVAIVAGGVVPAVIQRFQVEPSERTREREYIQRNIDATLTAFALDDVASETYEPTTQGTANALRDDAQTAASIRLLDPAVVSPAFRQLEQVRGYYGFPDALDVDRYEIDGQTQDTVIAVRELTQATVQDNWNNNHTIYTHGYGVVAAAGNQRSPSGQPAFIQQGIPSQGALNVEQPRIYFGESSPDFSIVGAPEGEAPRELDYPDDDAEGGEENFTYDADGGPSVGNLFNRLLYAIKFRDQNILLSDAVNSESQILYDRQPRERVEKVAPFLTLDGDPYPAVVDGRVVWIIDGYTTSNAYPYSQKQALDAVTEDSAVTTADSVAALQRRQVNYIRNSVKATVDAYTGEVDLYAWEDDDPLLDAWSAAFPGSIRPLSDIDGQLMAHLRYPEDLFKVQRAVLADYHVEEADSFFTREAFWQVPNDPTQGTDVAAGVDQPPYYLTLQMPGQDRATFSLTSSYIPRAAADQTRNVLTGFLAVDADAGSETGQKAPGYGTLRLLELPTAANISGPGQVQNEFDGTPRVSNELNLLRAGGATTVIRGNLLTLPIGGGLLYVQPAYIQGSGSGSYPLLQRVLVSFGDEIGFAETLDEALDQVFDGEAGANAGDFELGGGGTTPPTDPEAPPTTPVPPTEGQTPPPSAPPGSALAAALAEANQALQDGQEALAQGDFAGYGAAQERLEAALQRAIEAEAATGGGAAPAPATPEASPEATPPAAAG